MGKMFLALYKIQIDAVSAALYFKYCVCVFCVHVILYVLMCNMTDVQHVCGTLR